LIGWALTISSNLAQGLRRAKTNCSSEEESWLFSQIQSLLGQLEPLIVDRIELFKLCAFNLIQLADFCRAALALRLSELLTIGFQT